MRADSQSTEGGGGRIDSGASSFPSSESRRQDSENTTPREIEAAR